MVLEQESPQGVHDSSKFLTFELAAVPRLGEAQLQSLGALVRNLEGSLRLVNDLDLFGGVGAVDENRGLLHVAFRLVLLFQ